MDASRLDELSKSLATGAISRRTALRGLMAMGLGVGAGLLGRGGVSLPLPALAQVAPGQTQPPPPKPNPACTATVDMAHETYSLSATSSEDNLSLSLTTSQEPFQAPSITSPTTTSPVPTGTGGSAVAPQSTTSTSPQTALSVITAAAPNTSGPAPTWYARKPGKTTVHLAISRPNATTSPLLDVAAQTDSTGGIQITLNYGTGFQGVRQVVLSSTDGKTMTAVIDGRTTKPFSVGADPGSVHFTDGSALPQLTVDPTLRAAITRLIQKAGQTAASCTSVHGSSLPAGEFDRLADLSGFPTQEGLPDVGVVSLACIGCDDGCTHTNTICSLTAIGSCAFTFGIGCGALATCIAEYYGCKVVCRAPGNSCCPVWCPGNGDLCCAQDLKCTIDRDSYLRCCPTALFCAGICCFDNEECHGNICCAIGSGPACGSKCCASPNQICADPTAGLCCAPGEVNFNGSCCPQSGVCGNTCCVGNCIDPTTSNCCPSLYRACGTACCDVDAGCINGACCPPPQTCGSVCCPSGQVCNDASSGTCGPSGCPPGQVTPLCQSAVGATLVPNSAVCCSPSVYCCAGNCCKAGQLCCDDGTGFGCSDNCLH